MEGVTVTQINRFVLGACKEPGTMGNIRPVFFPFAPQSHNSFNSSFILLPTYYMPEILLGSREIPANKIERFCSHEFEFS